MKRWTINTLAFLFTTSLFAGSNFFLRVEIREVGDDGANVNLRLPLSTIRAFEDTFREALSDIEVDGHGIDLRTIWETLRDSGPTDFVEIQDKEGTIKVSSDNNKITVIAEGDYRERVSMNIPFALCDAIFTDADNVDFDNLITVLESMAGVDIINVDSDDAKIRIWIEQ